MDDNEEDRIRQTLAEFKSNDLIPGSFCKADIDFGIAESSEEEESSSDESMLSVENLITTREERTHHLMLKNAVYDPETLFLLCLGLCLADYKVDLAIRIIQVLYKVRVARPEMQARLRFLELLLAYSYLRLNQQQLKQCNNLSKQDVSGAQDQVSAPIDLVSNIDTSNLGSVSGRSTKQSAINQQIMGII